MSARLYARIIDIPNAGSPRAETVVVEASSPFDSNEFAATVKRLDIGLDVGHTRIMTQDQFWAEYGQDNAGDVYAASAAQST